MPDPCFDTELYAQMVAAKSTLQGEPPCEQATDYWTSGRIAINACENLFEQGNCTQAWFWLNVAQQAIYSGNASCQGSGG